MQVSMEELAMLLGQKDIEIFALQKALAAANKRVEELTPKPEAEAKAA